MKQAAIQRSLACTYTTGPMYAGDSAGVGRVEPHARQTNQMKENVPALEHAGVAIHI